MYLGLAADGYARYFDGRDPLRALAARFVTVGDELRMPSWSAAWHVKEARKHQVDGVVSLGEDDYFSVRRLEAAGIPVLSIAADNVDRRTWNEETLGQAIASFIEDRFDPLPEGETVSAETERPDAPPAEGPLAGLRVIDLTRALAGPFCTLVLAGLGADVIKVEDPAGGDIARGNAPYLGPDGLTMAASGPDDLSLAVLNRCRGKRSITLDLKRPGAAAVFEDLVRNADIVVENYSSGTADRLGIGYQTAQAANPAVIYCSISGFGAGGSPGVRAMDTIIQALSEAMLTSGSPDDPPIRIGVPMADVLDSGLGGRGHPGGPAPPRADGRRRARRRVDAGHADLTDRHRGLVGDGTARPGDPHWSDPAPARPVRHLPVRRRLGVDRGAAGQAGR